MIAVSMYVCFSVILCDLVGGTDVDCSHVAVLGGVNRKVDMISVGFARELR